MRFDTNEFYVKSPEEMERAFRNVIMAVENTVKIADRCNVEFEFGHTILPNFDIPEGITHYDFFRSFCYDGLKKRYSGEIYEKLQKDWNMNLV